MAKEFELFGLISLEPGAWSEWFSGAASFAAVVVALSSHWLTERARSREREEREIAVAKQIGWKLARLISVSHDYYRHFWLETDKSLIGMDGKTQKWRSTYPLIGAEIDPLIRLSQSEEDLLLYTKDSDLL
ncbi:MAG: hypothetical protein ACKOPE_07530, partial [Novosphingobium sp.]